MGMRRGRLAPVVWTILSMALAAGSPMQARAGALGSEGAAAAAADEQPDAQAPEGGTAPAEQADPSEAPADDDLSIDEAEPDFTVVNLPTALSVPRFKSAFRVSHRFARPLGDGNFGDLADDLFGFDNGAQIGLEYRFGVTRDAQIGIYRTSDKTIQFFGQYQALRPTDIRPMAVAVVLGVEGLNNFRDAYSPSVGAVVSYRFGSRGAVYAQPVWIGNAEFLTGSTQDDSAFVLGLSGRVSVHEGVYLVGEVAPRLVGYDAGEEHVSFGIEKMVGGHVFQLNFSNGIGTTHRQLVRDATEDWFIGFNISRKLW
jgi:hypothetical protein